MSKLQQIRIFNSILTFAEELTENFGEKQHSLKLYYRLLLKVKSNERDEVDRHVKLFSDFVVSNKEAILIQNYDKLILKTILYSQNINIKIEEIFRMSDKNNISVIWQHLLYLYFLVTNDKTAKDKLEELQSQPVKETEINIPGIENNFLQGFMQDIEQNINLNENTDPMSAISTLMSSGVLMKMVDKMKNGMENGSINPQQLMGSLTGMLNTSGMAGSDNPMSMISGLMNGLNGGTTPPDLNMLLPPSDNEENNK
jgi:hypothetical protein